MLERRSDKIQLALIVTMSLAGLWATFRLPPDALVPIHFDSNGVPNGWAGPAIGLFAMPVAAAAMWGLRALLPRLDPRGHNLARAAPAVDTIWIAVVALLAVVQSLILATTFGILPPQKSLALLISGPLLMVIGNVMGKLRPNFSVGIRTPWTLTDERVWDQTHRFGGKAFVLGGLVLVVLAATPLPTAWHGAAVAGVALGVAGAAVFKSYLLWRAMQSTRA